MNIIKIQFNINLSAGRYTQKQTKKNRPPMSRRDLIFVV